jgi:LysR family transcriptional regulator, glycine cleavage system transcriptional activator
MSDTSRPKAIQSFGGLTGLAVGAVEALLELPLLHDSAAEGDGGGTDWRSWPNHVGCREALCDRGQRFSDAGLLINAAVLGLGVALARASLVRDYRLTKH